MVVFVKVSLCNKDFSCFQQFLLLHVPEGESLIHSCIKIDDPKSLTAKSLLSNNCKDCKKMAALPQGAFAACKLRAANEREMTVARLKTSTEIPDSRSAFANKKLMEYSPVKYNGKLMNSIWGLYNRYSPHNIKGNDHEARTKDYSVQQPSAVASNVIAQNMSKAMHSGNEWR